MGRYGTATAAVRPGAYRRGWLAWPVLLAVLVVPVFAETLHSCHLPSQVPWLDTLSVGRAGWAAPPALCPGCLLSKLLVSALPEASLLSVCTDLVGSVSLEPGSRSFQSDLWNVSTRAPPAYR